MFRAQTIHRQSFDPNAVQCNQLLERQDRRLRRGLRLLQPVGASRHRAARLQADGPEEGDRSRQGRARRRRHALLHGRGLARAEGPRHGAGDRDGEGRQGARHGSLHDARHAERRPGQAARRRRPRLLQPQRRHLGRILFPGRHHPQLWRPARYAGQGARRRHQGLLRRHSGPRREADRSRRDAAHAGQPGRSIRRACRSTC